MANIKAGKGLMYPSSLTSEELADVRRVKNVAWVAYLWIVGPVYIYARYWGQSPFALFHARQGVIVGLALSFFLFVPTIGVFLMAMCFLLEIYGVINVVGGMYNGIPYVGDKIATLARIGDWEKFLIEKVKLSKVEIEGKIKKKQTEKKEAKRKRTEELPPDKPQWE